MLHNTPSSAKDSIGRKGITPELLRTDNTGGNGTGFLRYWKGARLVQIHAPTRDAYEKLPPPKGNTRGTVTAFSDKSRNRLARYLSTIKRKAEIRFLTLTYRRNQQDGNQAKTDLHAFFERLRGEYPHIAAIWKMELQTRGAVHFHMLLFGGWVPYGWISRTWDRIADNTHDGEHSCSTRIERPIDGISSIRYLLKYLCKANNGERRPGDGGRVGHARQLDDTKNLGRVWGTHNRRCVPVAVDRLIAANPAIVLATLDRWSETFGCGYRLQSVSIYLTTGEAEYLERLIRGHT